MTKHELLRWLEPFMDETDILVWVKGHGERDIEKMVYTPAGEKAAFVYLVADSPSPQPRQAEPK